MRAQVLDSMDLERERGITIKAQAVRVFYTARDGETYQLHLIDTPGHVDFTYEVSRSLAACEGAVLVVDASQGVEAQTVANTYLAVEAGLELIPCLNKIDLPGAEPERVAGEVAELIGEPAEDDPADLRQDRRGRDRGARADRRARAAARRRSRRAAAGADLRLASSTSTAASSPTSASSTASFARARRSARWRRGSNAEIDEIGFFSPQMMPTDQLAAGEVGYLITGIKDVTQLRVGDTLTTPLATARASRCPATARSSRWSSAGSSRSTPSAIPELRDALEKLTLNDAALSWEPETSDALGFGFRCGFLGLLHMDIVRERLEREYDLELLATMPSVGFEVHARPTASELEVHNPSDMPDPGTIDEIREPFITRHDHRPAGVHRRGDGALPGAPRRARRHALPLARARPADLRPAARRDRARLLRPAQVAHARLRLARLRADRHAAVEPRQARRAARPATRSTRSRWSCTATRPTSSAACSTERLRKKIPRQQYDVPIQAAIGSHVIARETVKAFRKDVIAKCYGGDITRKRKLLEKQKEGKKRMKQVGRIEVPQEAFLAVLELGDVGMTKLLFVCLGNICRSPTAEGVMRKLVAEPGLGGGYRDRQRRHGRLACRGNHRTLARAPRPVPTGSSWRAPRARCARATSRSST